jgi:HAMP domain-containing protein
MTERAAPARRPRAARVFWVTVLLFAALFALLTYGLASEQASPATPIVKVRKVIKRRVVTTIVPTPGQTSVSSSPLTSSASVSAGAEPVVTGSS